MPANAARSGAAQKPPNGRTSASSGVAPSAARAPQPRVSRGADGVVRGAAQRVVGALVDEDEVGHA